MTSGLKSFLVATALVALSALPLAAQNQASHGGGSAHASASTSGTAHGGTFGPGGRISTPAAPAPGNHTPRPNRGYGYRYPYGASILLPYDSEYDQLSGHGTFDQEQPPDASDNRVGPTIFEHNGQPTGTGDSRYGRHSFQDQQPQEEAQSESSAEPAGQPTVLVFRDGHKQEVANYAIAGSKLIVLGEKTQKIQLGDLDLNATSKANEDRGVEFKMPGQI
jgi:hypothetical protein